MEEIVFLKPVWNKYKNVHSVEETSIANPRLILD